MNFLETEDALEDFWPYPLKPKAPPVIQTTALETDHPLTEFEPPPPEAIPSERPLASLLLRVGDRPSQLTQADKKNYSERLSRELAQFLANSLRPYFTIVTPSENGRDQETLLTLPGDKTKRVDVMARDPLLRLVGSIKTIGFADARTGRFTKNATNRANDLMAEAMAFQGVCPSVGLFFLPIEACYDGERSSFSHVVRSLRGHRFSLMSVGVYEHEGDRQGHVRFLSVDRHAPNQGPPPLSCALTYGELVSEILLLAGVNRTDGSG